MKEGDIIYLVYRCTGCYEDYTEHLEATFFSLNDARSYAQSRADDVRDWTWLEDLKKKWYDTVDWENVSNDFDEDEEFLKMHPSVTQDDLDRYFNDTFDYEPSWRIEAVTLGNPANVESAGYFYHKKLKSDKD